VFAWHEDRSGVVRAVTDRSSGVSTGAYAGLNLGGHVGDDPEAVSRNRDALAERLGRPVAYMDQCHGAGVAVIDSVPEVAPTCDALVTASPDLALAVLVADCVPVLLAGEGVVAAVHAGRPGLVAGVVPAAVAAMRGLGADTIDAVVGPSVCGRCYEVPEAMRSDVAAVVPVAATVSWSGTPPSTWQPGWSPSCGRPASRCAGCPAAPGSARTCTRTAGKQAPAASPESSRGVGRDP
jgi:YfiH family protein